jgi:DNA-binding helix-hairpin-helix protein with protein kinase domain
VLQPDQQLGSGGEARIFALPDHPRQVAKLWHKPTEERASKLRTMLDNPPVDPMAGQGHVAIAWPDDVMTLGTTASQVVGFVMPRVESMHPIIDFFNPKTRVQRSPLFTWFYLHRTARNLVIAIRALHERGYVVGDLNESNILVAETALVTLVDTDSFQVWDAETGTLHRCRVGRPEFTPPEMQGHSFARVNREPAQDLFGVGTLVFQLLMEGTHPFAGVFHGPGEAPVFAERIAAGHFPHTGSAQAPYSPSPAAPKFGWLHPVLQDLFVRCFCDGHATPTSRPDTVSWQYGLEEAEAALVSCHDNAQHVFSSHLPACPWCERRELLGGRDPFPSMEAVQRKEHLKPPPRRRRTLPPNAGYRPHRTIANPWRSVFAFPTTGQPAPPTPPPIPKVTGSRPPQPRTSRSRRSMHPLTPDQFNALRQAFGALRRNDWAWAGFVVSLFSVMLLLQPSPRITAKILGAVAVLLGVMGEWYAGDWQCAGRGRGYARTAILVGTAALLLASLLP